MGVALAGLFVGCQEVPTPEPLEPSLELESSEVVAAPEGGHYSVNYTLLNPAEGAKLSVNAEYDWVSNIDLSVDGVISFDVAKCLEEDGRSCRLDVSYPGIFPSKTILVKQKESVTYSIALTAKEIKSTSAVVDIVPMDKQMTYVMVLGNGNYMEEAGLMEDDEALYNDYMETFQNMANGLGITLEGAVSVFMYQGSLLNHTFTDLAPNTKYVLFAYGFDLNTMTRTTEVCRLPIQTKAVEDYIVHFDLKADVVGYNVTLSIKPINYDGYFFFGVFEADQCPPSLSDSVMREYCEAAWEDEKGYYSSFFDTPEQGLHFIFNELAYRRSAELNVDLAPSTEYVLWAFGMNDEALLNTVPERLYFTTGAVAPSDNTFTLSATNLSGRGATVTVEPTNDDTYVAMLVKSNRFDNWTDKEIVEYIASLDVNYNSGAMSQSVDGLSPQTEYQLLVFGCEAGVATTQLYKYNFSTTAEEYASLDFEVRIAGYYDASEVAALYPQWSTYAGYAIVVPNVVVDENANRFYYTALESGALNYYSDEEIIQALLLEDPAVGDEVLVLPYDYSVAFVGFAVDNEGRFTKLWKGKPTTFKFDGRSPATDFVDITSSASAPAKAPAQSAPHAVGGLMVLN